MGGAKGEAPCQKQSSVGVQKQINCLLLNHVSGSSSNSILNDECSQVL